MGRVFGNDTVWFRVKCWIIDTFQQIIALPSYINPKVLKPLPPDPELTKLLVSEDICEKCKGNQFYAYDDMHSKRCEVCCPHDQGWWELTEFYAGYEEGKDNRCCHRGCGTMKRDLDESI